MGLKFENYVEISQQYLFKLGKLIKTVYHAVGKHQPTHIISISRRFCFAFCRGSSKHVCRPLLKRLPSESLKVKPNFCLITRI